MNDRLYLHEEILLLALRDEEGTIASGSLFTCAIAGAVLTELVIGERIAMVPVKKKQLVELICDDPFRDEVLNEALDRVRDAKRRANPQVWVSRFVQMRQLKHRIARGLCRKNILREDEDRILLIFKRKIYPERDPGPEREIIARLERAVFRGGEVDDRTRALLAICHHTRLLTNIFDKKRLKRAEGRIEHLISGDVGGMAAREAVQALQAAVIAATAATVVTTTVVT